VGPEEVRTVAHERDESAEAPDVGGEGVALELVENLWRHVGWSTYYERGMYFRKKKFLKNLKNLVNYLIMQHKTATVRKKN
jgi:hypothetical protein